MDNPKITLTSSQQRSLHLYFKFISDAFNDLGIEWSCATNGGPVIQSMYTPYIVKTNIWKPIQKDLFGITSTKDLSSYEMNILIDVITRFFGEKGVVLEFPKRILEQQN